jgi:toxin HigB-1
MIKTIRHKGLKLLWEEAKSSKLPADLIGRIERMMEVIDSANKVPDDFGAFANWNIHRLTGDMKEYWSIKVNKNYRIIFKFVDGHAYDLDYLDYH